MSSDPGPHIRLSGGQVLVALRLLTHLMAGEHVTRDRAFYQGEHHFIYHRHEYLLMCCS